MSEITPSTADNMKRALALKQARERAVSCGIAPALSVAEAQLILNIGTTKFYAERKAKRLRVCDIGTRSVVFADDLAAYQALLKSEADQRPADSPNKAA